MDQYFRIGKPIEMLCNKNDVHNLTLKCAHIFAVEKELKLSALLICKCLCRMANIAGMRNLFKQQKL